MTTAQETHLEDILVSRADSIGIITINRPETMNAIRATTSRELRTTLSEFANDDDIRVVILTGTGRAFCAGDDVKDIFARRLEEAKPSVNVAVEAEALRRHEPVGLDFLTVYPKPTIAAINGVAVGYGCDIALQCDFRIAAESARLGEVFIRRGLIPETGGLLILPLLVGWEKAHELVLTGDIIDAREALRIGMVGSVVPDDQLMPRVMEFARKLAAQSPLAQRLAKEGFRLARGGNLAQFFDYQRKAQELMFASDDHREGVRSFLEKREAHFTGH